MDRSEAISKRDGFPAPFEKGTITRELKTLLRQRVIRRRTGLVLVGGREEHAERTQLLSIALAATRVAGPAARVPSSYRVDHPGLPPMSSLQAAYGAGYRRIVLEDVGETYYSNELLQQYAEDACLIVGTPDVNAKSVFTQTTASNWAALDGLLGALTSVRLEGASKWMTLCDAFVQEPRPVNRNRYESAVDALQACRQFQWENQALAHLDAGRVTAARLCEQLLAWGMLSSEESEVIRHVERREAPRLRIWLYETLLARRNPPRLPFPELPPADLPLQCH
jgi:hypothetical protein